MPLSRLARLGLREFCSRYSVDFPSRYAAHEVLIVFHGADGADALQRLGLHWSWRIWRTAVVIDASCGSAKAALRLSESGSTELAEVFAFTT